MLEYAARKAAEAEVGVEFLERDMEEYTLPVWSVPFCISPPILLQPFSYPDRGGGVGVAVALSTIKIFTKCLRQSRNEITPNLYKGQSFAMGGWRARGGGGDVLFWAISLYW